MLATPVVKGKFWIVENDKGNKLGTIQSTSDGTKNVVLVTEKGRSKYPSIKVLREKHNITFNRHRNMVVAPSTTVYGFQADSEVFNDMFDVSKGLPVYTKSADSKSYFCAGYYIISFSGSWVKNYCPKLLTLERNDHQGPFRTEIEMKERLAEIRAVR